MANQMPFYKMFPDDWDNDLKDYPLEIEGAWICICNKLWRSETRGKATKTIDQWARILRVSNDDADRILRYLQSQKIGNVTFRLDKVTVESRRQIKEETERQQATERKRREREGEESQDGHDAVTEKSRTRRQKTEDIKEYTPAFENFWKAYPRKIEKKKAFKAWRTRLKEKHTAEEMTQAAIRYSKETARTEERYIKYASTFIGPDKPFLERLVAKETSQSDSLVLESQNCQLSYSDKNTVCSVLTGESDSEGDKCDHCSMLGRSVAL